MDNYTIDYADTFDIADFPSIEAAVGHTDAAGDEFYIPAEINLLGEHVLLNSIVNNALV